MTRTPHCWVCANKTGEIHGMKSVQWTAPNDVQPDRWDVIHGRECVHCGHREMLWVEAMISEETRVQRELPSLEWRAAQE